MTSSPPPYWKELIEKVQGQPVEPTAVTRLERLADVLPVPREAKQELAARILQAVAVGAPFLCRHLMNDPEILDWVLEADHWSGPRSKEAMAHHLARHLAGETEDEAGWMQSARRFRIRELLRIAARDLSGEVAIEEATKELSHLADVCLEAAVVFATGLLEKRFGRLREEDEGCGFTVVGLGKLGAEELNFSSDVDLLYLYASDGETGGGERGAISRHEWGVKAAQIVTRLVDRKTVEGRLFRVDLRLRPDGDAGPLAFTPQGCSNYYEAMGQAWERMMLLRARFCAGDRQVMEDFQREVQPFVYPRTIDPELVESVRRVKSQITGQLNRKLQPGFHVKLGTGGIREIEFFAQTVQILHAGRNPNLRKANTLELLDQLESTGLIDSNIRDSQGDDYRFLRRVEHRLQMVEDRQTHLLPVDIEERTAIAQSIGFADIDSFDQAIAEVRDRVHLLFQSLFETEEGREAMEYREAMAQEFSNRLFFVDLETARTVFSHWPMEELQQRDGAAIADGFALLHHVTEDEPVVAHFVDLGFGRFEMRLAAEDRTGLVAVCTGVLAAFGLDIQDGNIFTLPAGSYGDREVAGRAIEYLTVAPTAGLTVDDRYRRALTETLIDKATRWLRGEEQTVRGEVNRGWVEEIRNRGNEDLERVYPVDLAIDNRGDPQFSIVDLWSEDTPGFLYAFTLGLAMRGIDIHHIRIRTNGKQVVDRFHLSDRHGRKIITAAARHELEVLAVLIKAFAQFLTRSADPALALQQFDALLDRLAREEGGVAHFQDLTTGPLLAALATVLGSGSHLFEDFLRLSPTHLLPVLEAVAGGAPPLTPPVPDSSSIADRRAALISWRDAELFRVDCEHLLRPQEPFGAFGESLTRLAETVVEAAWHLAMEEVGSRTGRPVDENGVAIPWAIFALGKFGGRELGFASDLELMFVYGGRGQTQGPRQIPAVEFFERLVQTFKRNIPARREGIFELDLRLRPYGKDGSLASSLGAFERYYRSGGAAAPFERQALTRLRPCCGDPLLIQQVTAARDRFTYGPEPFDRAASLELRRRQIEEFTHPDQIHLKYGVGGVVEIEYTVQYLLLEHGPADVSVRKTNTLAAISALERAGHLQAVEAERLRSAYVLLRTTIDALRLERGSAKDLVLPQAKSPGCEVLGRRIGRNPDQFRAEVETTMEWVGEQFRRRFGQTV